MNPKSFVLILFFMVAVTASATVTASAREEKEYVQFQTYKEAVKQDPSLIRFYTFEEGRVRRLPIMFFVIQR